MEVAKDFYISKEYSVNVDVLPPFFAFVCIVGLLTNGVLMYVLYKTKSRNSSNTLLLNLAIADLIVIFFYLPFAVAALVTPSYPFGETICKITDSFYWASTCASVFTLISLSAHSFLDAPIPTLRWTQKNIGVGVAVVWILTDVLAAPTVVLAYVMQNRDRNTGVSLCINYLRTNLHIEIAVRLSLYVVIPLASVACFYCIAQRKGIASMHSQEQKYFLRLVVVLVTVYAVCFVPVYVVDLWIVLHLEEYNDFWHVLIIVTSFLSFAYRFLNPVALYCASGAFRKNVNRHLLCWCTAGNREPVPREREPVADLELSLQPRTDNLEIG